MDPNSGRLYTEAQMEELPEDERARLVHLKGSLADVERISNAVSAMNRAERRRANRAAGLRSNGTTKGP